MVNIDIVFGLAVFISMVSLIAGVSIRVSWRQEQERLSKQEKANRLSLLLNPLYRAKVEEDRAYSLELKRLELAKQKQQAELQLKFAEFAHKRFIEETRVTPETYILGYQPQAITPLPSLKQLPEKDRASEYIQQPFQQPTYEHLLATITPNSYTYSPGINSQTGETVIVDLLKVPHLKIIGSTGFGKSCFCGSVIDQLTTTHDPRRLQVALLDLEHKTSRLYEDRPHVATLKVNNKRLVQMVATSPDQVAEYLGFLYQEMRRREALSGQELTHQPVILIYIEEMLALQYEVIDPKLLSIIFQSLLLLAVRARKYGMFLLAAMQTDYSTDEMKINQKMFRFRGAAGVDPTAARAAGFVNTDLIKQNFQHGKPGQFVVEYPGFSNLVLTPLYDVERRLSEKFGYVPGFGQAVFTETPQEIPSLKDTRNGTETSLKTDETARDARFQEIRDLYRNEWGKVKIIEKVYSAKPGRNKKYLEAEAEYEKIIALLEQEEITA